MGPINHNGALVASLIDASTHMSELEDRLEALRAEAADGQEYDITFSPDGGWSSPESGRLGKCVHAYLDKTAAQLALILGVDNG